MPQRFRHEFYTGSAALSAFSTDHVQSEEVFKLSGIPFPNIDPIAFQVGPLAIRWYALAYLAGVLLGWWYCVRLAKRSDMRPHAKDFDDFVVWAIAGIVLGGRFGYVVFYNAAYYAQNPIDALKVWEGGMSFHVVLSA